MARNLAGYNIVKQERGCTKIDFEDAERIKTMATNLIGKPGVSRYVSKEGIEHHIAYATALLPDGKTSMGPGVSEFFMQSFVKPLFDGDTEDESWRALISFLTYDERFAGDSSVRHVYDVDASHGEVLAARQRIFSIRNAPYEGYSSMRSRLVSYAFRGYDMQKSLLETAIEPEHIDHLESRVERALARVAATSYRFTENQDPMSYPSEIRREIGVIDSAQNSPSEN